MNNQPAEINLTERRYVLDRMAEILASEYCGEIDLLYPEMVAALCKCDVRTLEAKGLPRIELGPRNIRYRRADVVELIRSNYVAAPKRQKKIFPQVNGGRVKSDLKADPRPSR
jgi:hypothetical protein